MTTADTTADSSGLTGNAFLDGLLQQTPPQVSQPRRGQNYNYPLRWYLKTDGTVVRLQGDPQSRAYYQDKGFRLLGQTQMRGGGLSEEQEYLQNVYPSLLKEQREKAAIINAIRRAGERYRDLSLEDTFDDYSIPELREYLKQIKEETGKDIRVVLPKRQVQREELADQRLMAGVETAESASIEGLQGMLERSRQMQGQGYDPTVEARKAGRRGAS